MTGSTWIIGEAPTRECERYEWHPRLRMPLTGRSGRRLAELAGLRDGTHRGPDSLLARFCVDNLFGTPRRRPWNAAAARARASAIRENFGPDDVVIVLGRRVARAFGVDGPWLARVGNFVIFPHPSGRSRWWNDPTNVARAAAVLVEYARRRP